MSRLSVIHGSPLRHTIRVVFESGTARRSTSSISVLSVAATTTTAARFRLSLAITSSETSAGTRGDQPRITVWSDSMTLLRPFRSSSIRWSTAFAIRPIRLPAMKMPATVTTSPSRRVGQLVSPANVPASTMRSIDCQNDSKNPSFSPPLTPRRRNTVITRAPTTISTSVSRPSQPMTTDGPRDSAVSNRYRRRAPNPSARRRFAGPDATAAPRPRRCTALPCRDPADRRTGAAVPP